MGQLAALVRAKYPDAYSDMSDDELESAVRAKYPGVYDDVVSEPSIADGSNNALADVSAGGEGRAVVHPHARTGAFVKRNLPSIMGGAAAVASGGASLPLQAIAAGGAGFLGARLRGDDRTTAVKEGAIQGALEGAGGAVTRGLTGAGKAIYRGLAKPSKALRDSFGGDDMVRVAIEEGLPLTARGADKASRRVGASREQALQLVQEAETFDPGVQAHEVLSAYAPVVKELRKRIDIGQPNQLAAVGSRGKALVKTANRTGGIPLTRAQTLKETAQDAASGAYRKLQSGASAQLGVDDLLDEATAKGLRRAIESHVPAVGAQNARTQRLLGTMRMIEDAVERGSNNNALAGMRDLIAIGGGAGLGAMTGSTEAGTGAGLLLALLGRPGMGSRAAIGLSRAGRVPAAQVSRLLQTLMSSHDTSQP